MFRPLIDLPYLEIKFDARIVEAMDCLIVSQLKIVMIVDDNGLVVGIITDGDIRRFILRTNASLNCLCKDAMNSTFISLSDNNADDFVLDLMVSKCLKRIPVIESSGKLQGLYFLEDFLIEEKKEPLPNKFFIMAGGRGTRLNSLTDRLPKPMIKVEEKPILEHIIEYAKSQAFNSFVLSLGYLPEKIMDYFGNGKKFGVNIEYLVEQAPLGTGGALSLLKDVPDHPIIVCNGDILHNLDFKKILKVHAESKSAATIVVRQHEIQNPFGVVETDSGGKFLGFIEKPVYKSIINSGVYVLSPSCFQYMEENHRFDMPEFLMLLVSMNKNVGIYFDYKNWIDIGVPDQLSYVRENSEIFIKHEYK